MSPRTLVGAVAMLAVVASPVFGVSDGDRADRAGCESSRPAGVAGDVAGRSAGEDESAEVPASRVAASTTTAQDGTCRRIELRANPPVLQVGLRANTQRTDNRYMGTFADSYKNLRSEYEGEIQYPAVEPGSGEITIRYLENGEPVQGKEIILWTSSRGQPGQFGSTVAHEHNYRGATPPPTIELQGQSEPGQRVSVRTDAEGRAVVSVTAGYRGGTEAVIAEAEGARPAILSVIVRDKNDYTHFADAHYRQNTRKPDSGFPFLLGGNTRAHEFNHFLRTSKAHSVAGALRQMWSADQDRRAVTAIDQRQRYVVLQDMSLEYGGVFDRDGTQACSEPGLNGHRSHTRGAEVDILPCYVAAEAARQGLGPNACSHSTAVPIDQAVLTTYVVGYLGAVLRRHGPGRDGSPTSYHIRLPIQP